MSTTTDEYQLDSSVSSKKKRPVESANEPLKRRRLAYGLTSTTSSAAGSGEDSKSNYHEEPSFLPFHLDLLESLYSISKEETTRAASSSEKLDPAIFDSARLFLQHRFKLLEAKQEAKRWNGIYQEALSLPDTIRPPTIHPSPGNVVPVSGLRQHSPLHSATTPMTTSHHLMMHAAKPHQVPCYNIVAHFIGRKSKKAATVSKEQVEPYRPLLEQVEKLVDALEKTIEEQQESLNVLHGTRLEKLLSSNPSTADCKEDDDSADYHSLTLQRRSILCSTEYKTKLWKMLVDDLKQVFA